MRATAPASRLPSDEPGRPAAVLRASPVPTVASVVGGAGADVLGGATWSPDGAGGADVAVVGGAPVDEVVEGGNVVVEEVAKVGGGAAAVL